MTTLGLWAALFCYLHAANAETASFIKSPMSQMKLLGDNAGLHCEVLGSPIPEIQWWYVEGEEPEMFTQLFDGAREDRVRINATYIHHAASSVYITNLTLNDTGTYECRASNDPDRNHLTKSPKVKWIRSQANVIVFEQPYIYIDPPEVTNLTSAVLSCNLTDPPSVVKGHYWTRNDKPIEGTQADSAATYTEYNLEKIDSQTGGHYACVFLSSPSVQKVIEVKTPPHVVAYKRSEHGDEADKCVLVCTSNSFPPVVDWSWDMISDSTGKPTPLVGSGMDKYEISSTPNKTSLSIHNLDMNQDSGNYVCYGSNDMGVAFDKVNLRVRSRLAALWPFLGIVAEVIVLVTIIMVYENRTKPEDIVEDDDSGSAPLKGNDDNNHMDKNVRQRNSN